MLSDRPYMREEYKRERTSVLTWLISAMVAAFVLQFLFDSALFGGSGRMVQIMGLSKGGLQSGWIWTLITHAFLHSTHFIFHAVFNVLALYFLGRELMPMLGTRRFLGLLGAATVIGGLAWAAVNWRSGVLETHIGATAAVYALFVVFACFFPNQQISFLLFFLFPITLKPKHIAIALGSIALLGLVVYELPGSEWPFGGAIGCSAHLGGILTGLLYYRFVHDAGWASGSITQPDHELPRWLTRTRKPVNAPLTPPTPVPATNSREDIRAEIDRILDKINSAGFASLTAEEKRVLDGAKDILSRR